MKNEFPKMSTDQRFEYAKANHTLKVVAYMKGQYENYNGQIVQKRKTFYGFPEYYNQFLRGNRTCAEMEFKKLFNHLYKIGDEISVAILYTRNNEQVLRWNKVKEVYVSERFVFDKDDDGNSSLRIIRK
jgi:hypothetical protein